MSDPTTCPVCQSPAKERRPTPEDLWPVECPRCGKYSIVGSAVTKWDESSLTAKQRANASGWIREHQTAQITTQDFVYLSQLRTPSVAQRAHKVLLEIERRWGTPGDIFTIRLLSDEHLDWLGVSWCSTPEEFFFVISDVLADEMGCLFIKNRRPGGIVHDANISPHGFAVLDSLRSTNPNSYLGFCAMSFAAEVTPAWLNAISPAIEAAGYDGRRLDFHDHNNHIYDEIIASIRSSKFLIADLTGDRGGVYFEAGFALGLGLPVIWTCNEADKDKIHFDAKQHNFIYWAPDNLPEFRSRLQNRIEATLGKGEYRRPA